VGRKQQATQALTTLTQERGVRLTLLGSAFAVRSESMNDQSLVTTVSRPK
jgi:hypothetical protein